MLDTRKKQILKAIVEDYVRTAEPVGSRSLMERHAFQVSAATIRNEMAELEELGYLEKPHTSAGRVPSDRGYRSYVDDLVEIRDLEPLQAREMRALFKESLNELSELVERAAKVLAQQTDFISLVLTPRYGESQLSQIKMLMIEPGKVLVVVVLSAGLVKDRLIRISDAVSQKDLETLARSIEKGLSGRKLSDITLVAVTEAAESDASLSDGQLNQILYEAYVSIKQAEQMDVYISGTHNLLNQPEYRDVDKAHRLLEALGRERVVAGYLTGLYGEEGGDPAKYLVRIGQEIALDGFEDTSFVTSCYRVGGKLFGQIGVLGPRRMDYGRIISQIHFVNQTLNKEAANRLDSPGEQHEEDAG